MCKYDFIITITFSQLPLKNGTITITKHSFVFYVLF